MKLLLISTLLLLLAILPVSGQSGRLLTLVDSFGRINCGDAQGRTDYFVSDLWNNPFGGGLIEVTPNAADPVGAFVTLQEITAQLRARRFDESRVNILVNPARTEMSIRLWRELSMGSSRPPEPAGALAEIEPLRGAKAIMFGSSVLREGPTCGDGAYDLNVFALAVNQIPAVKARVTVRAKNAVNAKKLRDEVRAELGKRGIEEAKVRFVNVKSTAEGVELWLEPDRSAAAEYRVRIAALREVEKYSADIDRDVEDVDAYISRARAYKTLGRLDEAVDDLTRAIELSKHPYYIAQSRVDRGEVHMKRGDHANAIADFTAVIGTKAAEPYKPRAYLKRGEASLAKGDRDAAVADSGEAIKLYSASKVSGRAKGLANARILRAKALNLPRSL